MFKLDPARCERLSDSVLGLLLVLPAVAFVALSFDCGPWDESRTITCASPLLAPIAQILQGMLLLMAFGGFLLYLPIVGGAWVNSTRYKRRAWKAGTLRKLSPGFFVWAVASVMVGLVGAFIVLSLLFM